MLKDIFHFLFFIAMLVINSVLQIFISLCLKSYDKIVFPDPIVIGGACD